MLRQTMMTFTVSATNVNLADTVPYTVATIQNSTSDFIKVPVRLELQKDAGTAYSITTPTWPNENPRSRVLGEKYFDPQNYASQFGGGEFLIVEGADDKNRAVAYFYVPLDGFLNSSAEQKRLSFPNTSGMTFGRPVPTKFRLRLSRNVASGTGSLRGRLFFDEYTLGGF